MAKRTSRLAASYNPIKSKLEDFNNVQQEQGDNKKKVDTSAPTRAAIIQEEEEKLLVKENIQIFDKELSLMSEEKSAEVKFRCSNSEKDDLHDLAKKITGRRNTLSNVLRSFLILLQFAEQEIEVLSESIHSIKVPASNDRMQLALYEKKIASVLWRAIKKAKSSG